MIERQTPPENYNSNIAKHLANVIHKRQPNPQGNSCHEKENVTYYE